MLGDPLGVCPTLKLGILAGVAPTPARLSVPPLTVAVPVKLFAPFSVTVPGPLLTSEPVPASAALTVPDCRSNTPDDDSVPFPIVPPVSTTPPSCVCVVPPRSSVPPATVVLPEVLPSVPAPAIRSTPPLIVVPPV